VKPLPSIAGLRAALIAMAILSLGCGFPMAGLIPDLEGWGGDTPAKELHRTAVTAVLAFAIAPPVYLLSAIHVGRTKRGHAYLKWAAVAFGLQAVMYLFAQPFLGCIALLPTLVAGIIAMVQSSKPQLQDRLYRPSLAKLLLWPELLIVPIAAALVTALILQVNRDYVPEEPNPPRDFDSSEGWQRLDDAVAATLPAFEAVDEFPGLPAPYDADYMGDCDQGAKWNETWIQYDLTFRLGDDVSIADSPWRDYLELLRTRWAELGYVITTDAPHGETDHTLTAVRDDGVTIKYQIFGGGADLDVSTGCIEQVGVAVLYEDAT
jgi:hypothetical protein